STRRSGTVATLLPYTTLFRSRRGRGVDREHLLAGRVLLEGVHLLAGPDRIPLFFQSIEVRLIRNVDLAQRRGGGGAGRISFRSHGSLFSQIRGRERTSARRGAPCPQVQLIC